MWLTALSRKSAPTIPVSPLTATERPKDASLRVDCIVGTAVGAVGLGVGEGVPCADASMGLAVPSSSQSLKYDPCQLEQVSEVNAIKMRTPLSDSQQEGRSGEEGSVIGDGEHSASGVRHGELLPDLNLRRHCDHLYNTSTTS